MEIEEFAERKKALEQAIGECISKEMRTFKEATGYTPCGITVYIVDVSTLGDKVQQYVVGEVVASVPL